MFLSRTRYLSPAFRYLYPVFALGFGVLLSVGSAFAGSADLKWDPVPGASGYRVAYGTTSGKYTGKVDAGSRTSLTVWGLADGTRYYFAVQAYAGSLTSDYSSESSTVIGALVAAYAFDEASGSSVTDSSGKGNHGILLNAQRTSQGKFGRSLSFNGSNSLVTVGDSNSLDLSRGMTLTAWVYPSDWASGWKSLVVKERTGGFAYALNANSDVNRPNAALRIGGSDRHLSGGSHLSSKAWTHLAATYDGSVQRLFVNGVQVGSRSQTGYLDVSASPLRIGGYTVSSGRYFKGLIDEVRVYNRALNQSEISAVAKQAIGQ